jgi:hypothetical protein
VSSLFTGGANTSRGSHVKPSLFVCGSTAAGPFHNGWGR